MQNHGKAMTKISIFLIFLLVACTQCLCAEDELFSLRATTTWREYPINLPTVKFHKEKWAWTCSLMFRSKQPVKLTSLAMQWKGAKLDQLSASLYQKKEKDHAVIPIQENFVCDGTWNPLTQQLVFTPNEKIVAVNNYYLMVSFPKKAESLIKKGRFSIVSAQLCQPPSSCNQLASR